MLKYLLLAATVVLTVYGQLIVKSRSLHYSAAGAVNQKSYLVAMFSDPWVISGLGAAALASAAWMLAVREANLSYLYPFMAINFALVTALGATLFGEAMSGRQIAGVAVVVIGLLITWT